MGKLRNMLKQTRIGDAALVAALGTFAFGGVFVGDAASQEAATSGSRALAVVAKDAGKCGALLVGVDEYETLTPLEYASSDVRKLRDALVEIGFPSETIRTFVSDGRIRERPSRAKILAALDEILAASGPDSTVLIALSGHGFETENGDAAFCPEDVVVKKNGDKTLVKSETAILIEDVAKRLRQDDAKFKLLIVDACREPASTEKGATSKTRSFPSISEARGVAFLQSCESREFSWEHSELKGGVFTHYFAEGLRGAADSDGDGGVSFLDVCNYATSQTQRFVRDKRDASQTPFYRFSGVVDFWLKPPTRTGGGTTGGGVNAVAEADYRKGRELAFGLNGTKIDGRRGFALLTKAADAGSIDAQAELAELYLDGCDEAIPAAMVPDAARAYGLAFDAAQSGNPFALCVLGQCYGRGLVVAGNENQAQAYFARAFREFEKRAKKGDVRATNYLGLCYERGIGVAKDEAKAVELYRQASDAGYCYATGRLAFCYDSGIGVAQDGKKAIELYHQASDAGLIVATGRLAEHYQYEVGGAQGKKKAVELLRQAVDAGAVWAMLELSECYEYGTGVEKDEKKAVELLCQAVDAGEVSIIYSLAERYEYGTKVEKNEKKAFELYRQASDTGNINAMYSLGRCYERGIGVAKNESKAFEFYRKAMYKGHIEATINLGVCYERGIGVEKDERAAFMLYHQAAEAGNALATNNLGVCYERGMGVEKDVKKAVELYRQASDAGGALATRNLGGCYEYGTGVTKDLDEAERLYRKAMEIDPAHKEYVETALKRMGRL